MIDAVPGQLADVDQAVHAAADFDEGAEVHELAHHAFVDLARLERVEQFLAGFFLFPFQHGAAAEHEVPPHGIGFGDQAAHPLADELRQVLDAIRWRPG